MEVGGKKTVLFIEVIKHN